MTTERYVDRSDLDPRHLRPSRILQALSPEVAQGSSYSEARPGDFLISYEDSEQLVARAVGVTLLPIVTVKKFVEWPADRGEKSPPIDEHDFCPVDAEWVDIGGRKFFIRLSTKTRIEKTLYVHTLVGGVKTTFAFKSLAYDIAEDFARDADKVRTEIDGDRVHMVGAFWKLTAELERKNNYTWFGPRFEPLKLGAFGEANGPSLDLVRLAKSLRFEFNAEADKRKKELAALSAVRPTPALTRGMMSITSGIAPKDSWAAPKRPAEIVDPKPAAPPPKTVDPKLNDSIDDIPWT